MQIPRWDRVPRHPQGGVGKLLSATFNGLSHIDGDCAVEVVAGGAGILGGIQMTFFDLHGQIGTVVGKMFSGGVSFGIGGGKWNAVVSQGIVTLYVYTITVADSAHSNVYYYSMSVSTPPNFHNAPAPSFRVFNYPAKGAVPVYMFTIQMNDSVGTLVYYYSLSASTPPNFNGPISPSTPIRPNRKVPAPCTSSPASLATAPSSTTTPVSMTSRPDSQTRGSRSGLRHYGHRQHEPSHCSSGHRRGGRAGDRVGAKPRLPAGSDCSRQQQVSIEIVDTGRRPTPLYRSGNAMK